MGEYVIALIHLYPGHNFGRGFLFILVPTLKPVHFILVALFLGVSDSKAQEIDYTIFRDEDFRSRTVFSSDLVEQVVADSVPFHQPLEDLHLYRLKDVGLIYGLDLGNNGSIMNFPGNTQPGFNTGWNNFNVYNLNLDTRKIQFSPKAFSRARYVNGSKRENAIEVDLASRFGKLLYGGFHFDRIRALGFYNRQTTDNTEINLFAGIRSKDFRYQAMVNFGWNGITNQENGGIARDSLFDFGAAGSREFLSVNLANATRRVRQFGFRFDQGFILTKWRKDSINPRPANRLRLLHKLNVNENKWIYEDIPDSTFYENIFLDSTTTLDSTRQLSVRNELGVQFIRSLNDSLHKPRIYAFAAHEFNRVTSDTLGLENHNISVGGKIALNIKGKVRLNAQGEVWLAGNNQGDVSVNAGIPVSIGEWEFGPSLKFLLVEPAWKHQQYSSNHFRWNNSFAKQSDLTAGVRIENRKWRTGINFDYQLLGNFIYYDTSWTPQQASDVQQLVNLKLDQKLNWRWIHFDVNGKLSYLLSGDAISVPLFNGRASIYYENRLFKRRLKLQIGMDAWFFTQFEAYGYIPALAEFHRSNERLIGNYPYLDAWISIRRKKLSAFFMVSHWNAGLMGNNYYQHLHYPANDLALRFGVDWVFLD